MKSGDFVDERYEILCEVASGGMATVYAARVVGAEGFERLVALKRMLPNMNEDERYRRMFLDEARVAAHIHSPFVASTFDLGQRADGSMYIVMDLILGAALSSVLSGSEGRNLPLAAVATVVEQSARGLHDAHTATNPFGEPLGIVHRDISPQNILIGVDGAARITDFGVAYAVERLTKTVGVSVKGKLAYCSPEQARGEALDHRSDIFALGVVLWESMTLRRLFRGASPADTMRALLQEPIPDPRTIRPEIPASLAEIALRALRRDRSERFSSAVEMAEALRASGQSASASDVSQLVRDTAGMRLDGLVSKIQEAIRRSDVRRDRPPAPSSVAVARETVATRTLMSLAASAPERATRPLPSQGAAPRTTRPLRAKNGATASRATRPLRPSAPPAGPSNASEGPPPGTPAPTPDGQSTQGKRQRTMVFAALGIGALLVAGGVGAGITLSLVDRDTPAEGTPAPAPVGLPSAAPAPLPPSASPPAQPAPSPSTAGAWVETPEPPSTAPAVAPSDKPPTPSAPNEAGALRRMGSPASPMQSARGRLCTDTCNYAHDGECDDGGPNSISPVCTYGTDCADCGPRRRRRSGERPSCDNTCTFHHDGDCDDGGSGSVSSVCQLGTDCADCGRR